MSPKGVYERTPLSKETLFWRHVTPTEGCWLWHGPRTTTGYGHIRLGGRGGKEWTSNRLSWVVHFGPIPDGLYVLHTCDVKLCVRPEHLYLGTQADNARDASERGLLPIGHRNTQSKLTVAVIPEIRQRVAAGEAWTTIGRSYGVTYNAIKQVAKGNTWRHVA